MERAATGRMRLVNEPSLANAVANVLNVPFVIVRRDLKITEGSTVSVNYVSGSSGDRIEKMFLSKRSLKAGSRVLIVDDFLKGGGTITGMISLLSEFDSELAGVAVFADNAQANRDYLDYKSLLKVTNIDVKANTIDVEIGNILTWSSRSTFQGAANVARHWRKPWS